jgi:hypothetical protein
MRKIAKPSYHGLMRALPSKLAIKLMYFRHFGCFPNLSNPKNFNEKIQHSKLTVRNPLMTVCADKVLVKKYVSDLIGAKYVIPTIWSGLQFTASKARTWPIPFVIKANNASGTNHFVRSQEEQDWVEIESLCKEWLAKPFSSHLREWAYQEIRPQILVEPFISNDHTFPVDYKVFVFNGVSHFIQILLERETNTKHCFYNRTWEKCDFYKSINLADLAYDGAVAAPQNLEKMLLFAEILSGDFPFVRCDFYEVEGALYFGEMTFYSDSGYGVFTPRKWDRIFGDLW